MAEANIQLLYGDCLKNYTDSMQKVVNETEPFLSLDRLHRLHEQTKHESLSKVSGEILKYYMFHLIVFI